MIKRGDEAALQKALEQGLDPDIANRNGWSLLMLAALEGAVPLGELLLAKNANIDGHNRSGETPLSLAAQKGHVPFLRLLLQHGASKDCKPHGATLSNWLTADTGLTEPERSEILQILGV